MNTTRKGQAAVDGWMEQLARTGAHLEARGIWHCLAPVSVLCVLSDVLAPGELGPPALWVRPDDLALLVTTPGSSETLTTSLTTRAGDELALAREAVDRFVDGSAVVSDDQGHCATLIAPHLFQDGVLRRVDLDELVYWEPADSLPHWFVSTLETVEIDGQALPVPRAAEALLARRYGPQWRDRSAVDLAVGRADAPPHLHALISGCRARGWDTATYGGAKPWPRMLRGAGPASSVGEPAIRSPWWRDLPELVRFY